jgi:acyl-CoA-binding protein
MPITTFANSMETESIESAFTCARRTLKDISALENTIRLPKGFPKSTLSQRLQSYAFYKQATKGDYGNQPASKKAGANIDPLHPKSAIYQKNLAWSRLAGMEGKEAKQLYIRLVINLLKPYYMFKKEQHELSQYLRSFSAKEKADSEVILSFFAKLESRISELASVVGVSLADLKVKSSSIALSSPSQTRSLKFLSPFMNPRVLVVLLLTFFTLRALTLSHKVKLWRCLTIFLKKFNS